MIYCRKREGRKVALIQNLIDMRDRPGRWRTVRAVLQPAGQGAVGAEPVPAYLLACDIQTAPIEREAISIAEAVRWASAQPWPVDLYLHDDGG